TRILARDDGMVPRYVHKANGIDVAGAEPGFQAPAVRASVGERDYGQVAEIPGCAYPAVRLRRDQHDLFPEYLQAIEPRRVERFGDEGRFELARVHPVDERAGRAGSELDLNIRVEHVVLRQYRRKPRRGRALQRADAQRAAGLSVPERRPRLGAKAQELVRVSEQHLALGGDRQAAALAQEELRAELVLQLPDPRRHV